MTISLLLYTHTEYSFLWKAIIPLLIEHVKDIQIHWLCNTTNGIATEAEELPKIPEEWIKHYYNEDQLWTARVLSALEKIEDEYVLFIHEDWLPIGKVDINILHDMTLVMTKNNIDFLLSYTHISTIVRCEETFSGYDGYYFYKEYNHVFQPAIWRKDTLQEFCATLKKRKNQNEDEDCLQFMRKKSCYSIQNKSTVLSIRTKNSLFYPHMHAMSEGLWNFLKYPPLKEFLETFGINTNTRGVHTWWELDTQ